MKICGTCAAWPGCKVGQGKDDFCLNWYGAKDIEVFASIQEAASNFDAQKIAELMGQLIPAGVVNR